MPWSLVRRPLNRPTRRRPTRRGFTLVELLIVLVIIAMLMGLLTVAVVAALRKGEQTRLLLEMNEIAGGLHNYKDAHGAYPPSFAAYDTTANAHQTQIMRHLANAFPQYIQDTSGSTAGTPDLVHDYLDFQYDVEQGTLGQLPPAYDPAVGLDVNLLDQAEALTFWLGGLPSHTTESRLIGFSLNPANPFESDTIQPQRTRRHYEFATVRLVDEDEDGWLEYIPPGAPPVGVMPPYVYFDATSYNAWTVPTPLIELASYPSSDASVVARGPDDRVTEWGVAWPLWRVARDPLPPTVSTPPTTPAQWVNSDSFQLICAGDDGAYSDGASLPTMPTVFTDGFVGMDSEDPQLDNLANFAEGTMEDERDEHQ